jgi:hypothetical protein
MGTERRYTEAELNALFARAARRQEQVRRADDASARGLTLAEAQRIGAEAGIAPAHLAAAAAELDAPAVVETQLGAPVVVERVRLLPEPLSEAGWARMVAEARRAFGETGAAGQVGGTREWTSVGTGFRRDVVTRLVAEPMGDETRLVLHQSARGPASVLHGSGALMVVMTGVIGVLLSSGVEPSETLPAMLICLTLALLMLGGTQLGLRMWQKRQDHRFEALLDRLELVARDLRSGAAAMPEGTPPLDTCERLPLPLDALGEAPSSKTASTPQRTRT